MKSGNHGYRQKPAVYKFGHWISILLMVVLGIYFVTKVDGRVGGGVGVGSMRGGFGRSGGAFGGGRSFGGGGGWNSGFRTRWWLLGAGGLYGGYRTREYMHDKSQLSPEDELSSEESFVPVWGFAYAITWFIFLLYKFMIKPGRYSQSEFSIMYALAFLCLSAFTLTAYNIRLDTMTSDEEAGLEGRTRPETWVDWFEPNSTKFVMYGGSPLNYMDIFYCAAGLGISTLLVVKDVVLTDGTFRINLITKMTSFAVGCVLIVGVIIGLTQSWKLPLIMFSVTGLLIAFIRYIGLLIYHRAESREISKRNRKYKRFEVLEFIPAIFSIIFHVTLSDAYDDCSIALVNAGVIGFSILALVFDPIFLIILYIKPRRSPDELYAEGRDSDGMGSIIMCHAPDDVKPSLT